jgi:hypothetical protein
LAISAGSGEVTRSLLRLRTLHCALSMNSFIIHNAHFHYPLLNPYALHSCTTRVLAAVVATVPTRTRPPSHRACFTQSPGTRRRPLRSTILVARMCLTTTREFGASLGGSHAHRFTRWTTYSTTLCAALLLERVASCSVRTSRNHRWVVITNNSFTIKSIVALSVIHSPAPHHPLTTHAHLQRQPLPN